jgi:lipopolysaccharide transport system ATP-binding protein
LSGVFPPTDGTASIERSISSFIDPTLGIDPKPTGRDNIIFRRAFMGWRDIGTFMGTQAKK